MIILEYNCSVCGNNFQVGRGNNRKYCSSACSKIAKNRVTPLAKAMSNRRWISANREKIRMNSRTTQARFNSGRASASKRGILWSLSYEDYLSVISAGKCVYCDGPLPEVGCGLDRKDNSLSYTLNNVIPCCSICNRVKGSFFSFNDMRIIGRFIRRKRTRLSSKYQKETA